MQYRYAIAEGALYRTLKWKETTGTPREFLNDTEMLKHAEQGGWDLVTVMTIGSTGNYRQWFFKNSSETSN